MGQLSFTSFIDTRQTPLHFPEFFVFFYFVSVFLVRVPYSGCIVKDGAHKGQVCEHFNLFCASLEVSSQEPLCSVAITTHYMMMSVSYACPVLHSSVQIFTPRHLVA